MDLMGTFGNALFHIALVGPIFPEIHFATSSDWIPGSSLRRGKKRTPRGKSAEKNEEFLSLIVD